MEKKRINIGLFTGNIMDSFDDLICQGAIYAAEEMDANLIIVPGNYLDLNRESELGLLYEYQANTLFSYGDPGAIDVLIVCLSSIGCLTTNKRRREFLQSISKVPIVTIASVEEGHSSIMYDNRSGLEEALNYLIRNCKKTKIAMLSGPPDNADFAQRLETFKDVMEENGLKAYENSIIFGDASYRSRRAAEEVLDHNPGVEAVVCANDAMAQALYEVCKERDIKIGRDLLITGFDDIDEAKNMNPPLATVKADVNSMGYQAVKLAVKMLEGHEPEKMILPTHFIKRESVNYQADDVRTALRNMINHSNTEEEKQQLAEKIFEFLSYHQLDETVMQKSMNNLKKIIDCFTQLDDAKCSAEDLLIEVRSNLKLVLTKEAFSRIDQHRLLMLFTILLQEIPFCNKSEVCKKVLLSALTAEQRFTSNQLLYMADNIEKERMEIAHNTNIMARDMIMSDSLGERSYQTILANLPMLDIQNSYLYTYEKPVTHGFKEEWNRPENILLKAYQKGVKTESLPRTRQKMKSSQILTNEFVDKEERHTWVLLDIYSCEQQYGVFLCDLKFDNSHLVEFLTYQISSCVRTIQLFQREVEMQKELEETLEQLKMNNVQLDRISKYDELTGELNRRGFMEEAELLLKKAVGKDVLVMYADLDSLKIINDTFGHEDGDFSIVAEARILSAVHYKRGVFGRIGGDEFAGIMICENGISVESVREHLNNAMRDFNMNINKPYRVQISAGIDQITYEEGMALSDMMSQADDLLYKEKKNKKNILEKEEITSIDEDEIERLLRQQFNDNF